MEVLRDLRQGERRDAGEDPEERPDDQPRIVRTGLAEQPAQGRVHRETFAVRRTVPWGEFPLCEVVVPNRGLLLPSRRSVGRRVSRLPQADLRELPLRRRRVPELRARRAHRRRRARAGGDPRRRRPVSRHLGSAAASRRRPAAAAAARPAGRARSARCDRRPARWSRSSYPFWPLALIALLDSKGSHLRQASGVAGARIQHRSCSPSAVCSARSPRSRCSASARWRCCRSSSRSGSSASVVYACKVWQGDDVHVPIVSDWVDARLPATR